MPKFLTLFSPRCFRYVIAESKISGLPIFSRRFTFPVIGYARKSLLAIFELSLSPAAHQRCSQCVIG